MKNSGNDVLHADEGLLHSYLDGALRPDERLQVESHVAGCPPCAAALQEARQLKSQATKILTRARPVERTRPQPRKMPDRRRKRPMLRLGWAASLFLAIGAGWLARTYFENPFAAPSQREFTDSDRAGAGTEGLMAAADSGATLTNATPALEENEAPRRERALASRSGARRDAPDEGAASKAAQDRQTTTPRDLAAQQRAGGTSPPAEPSREERLAQVRSEETAGRVSAAVTGPESAPAADAISSAMPRRVYAQPPVEVLPGYDLVEVATGVDPLLVVTQASEAGDTVVLVYQPADAPDSTRVFDQGVVLERNERGQPVRVAGRYRVIGSYRVIATGGVSRDSLGVLLRLLDLR